MIAILLEDFVWEGTKAERLAGVSARDGQVFKELDTGDSYLHRHGDWVFLDSGLSLIKATKSGRITTDEDGLATVTFNTPFVDDAYSVVVSVLDTPGKTPIASKFDITVSGFKIKTKSPVSGLIEPNISVSWLATRDYDP